MNLSEKADAVYRLNYDEAAYVQGNDGPKKITLNSGGRSTCRYCGRGKPEVTFKDECHALPESIGNYTLFSSDECDSCNQFFGIGGGIEDHLAKWSLPFRVILGICGKNGVPSIKREHAGWRVDSFFLNLNMSMRADQLIVDFNENNKSVVITIPRDSFIPVAVFKAFVKMAIAILPRENLGHFSSAIEWIRNPDHSVFTKNLCPTLFCTQSTTIMPQNFLTVALYRRYTADLDKPYLVLFVAIANYMFQLCVPCDDGFQNSQFEITMLPLMLGTNFDKPVIPESVDLRGVDKVKNELVRFPFIFGEVFHRHISREENIGTAAYYLWLADGCPDGQSLAYWLRAEEQITEQSA